MSASNAPTVALRAPEPPAHGNILTVSSQAFASGASIPLNHAFHGCGGKNISPDLAWTGAPAGTRSFAVTCFDPDAPTGSGYWHWLAYDIPVNITSLAAGAGQDITAVGGRTGTSDFGMTGYSGPYPPMGDGDHRYIFTVYALDVETIGNAGDGVSGATLIFMMNQHVLATGTLIGRFGH
jgi:Raf kinase inhibitor-like YbhB/YbcL family protein